MTSHTAALLLGTMTVHVATCKAEGVKAHVSGIFCKSQRQRYIAK